MAAIHEYHRLAEPLSHEQATHHRLLEKGTAVPRNQKHGERLLIAVDERILDPAQRSQTLSDLRLYIASHSKVAPEHVGLQKEKKCNTFACHTCNEVRLCVLGIRKKEVGNTKR
jgi:hypothetical protein